MRTKIDCCYKCTERQADPNCHGFCERYLTQKAELEESNAEIRKRKNTAINLAGQTCDCVSKVTKRRNYRAKYRRPR